MNVGDVKSSVPSKAQQTNPNQELKAKLQEQGLQQAARFQETRVSLSVESSNAQVGMRVLSASFGQTISIGQGKFHFEPPAKEKNSLFDFEEVAKNVLNFVGGAIKSAKANGADDEELNGMFEKATSGVMKGIEMARKDLAGFMNGEIDHGINESQRLIQSGIDELRAEIFGTEDSETQTVRMAETQIDYQRENSGQFEITTNDGDKVTISFANAQGFQYNQSLLEALAIPKQNYNSPKDSEEDSETEDAEDGEGSASLTQRSESLNIFERNGLSIQVDGELDEGELEALANLVGDIKGVADSFFQKDIEGAFNKALELGFDESELSGYALQLTQTEQIQVVQTYAEVSQYADNDSGNLNSPRALLKPIGDYMGDVMSMLDSVNRHLSEKSQFDGMLAELFDKSVNHGFDNASDAQEKFGEFNQKLLRGMPNFEYFN